MVPIPQGVLLCFLASAPKGGCYFRRNCKCHLSTIGDFRKRELGDTMSFQPLKGLLFIGASPPEGADFLLCCYGQPPRGLLYFRLVC